MTIIATPVVTTGTDRAIPLTIIVTFPEEVALTPAGEVTSVREVTILGADGGTRQTMMTIIATDEATGATDEATVATDEATVVATVVTGGSKVL